MHDDSAPTTNTRRARARLVASILSIAVVATVGVTLSADAGTENLLSRNQQTFETRRDAGWAARDGASVRTSTAHAHRGERSMELRAGTTIAGGTTNPSAVTLGPRGSTAGVTVRAGATYEGSIWTRSGSSARRAVRCDLVWFRSNGTQLAAAPGALVTQASGSWQRVACRGTAPAGAVRAMLRVSVQGAASGERHYFDEAWLVDTGATAAPTASSFAFRRNVGSTGQFVSTSGAVFAADGAFLGGSVFAGGPAEIQGTTDDALYRKHRWGLAGYDVPVPGSGTYTVRLHFAETVMTRPGQRVFDVAAEGSTVLNDLDVQARVGTNVALVEQFTVNVTDGTLNLRFSAVVEDPMLSGLEVLGSGAVVASPVPTTTASTAPPRVPATAAPAPTTTAPPTTAPPTTAPPTTAPPTTAPPTTAPPTAPAPSGSFPNASNTGVRAGTTLRPSGSITTTAPGQVIENLDIRGSIFVNHNNVTIRNVRIRSAGQAIRVLGPTGLVVEDCELDGTGATDGASAIGDYNYTLRRCNVHHFGEGPRSNGNVVIEDNYFHDFLNFIRQGAHQDVIQITSGSNHTIRHNTMLIGVDGANAALMIGSYQGSNVLVENNLLGGGGYTAYCGGGTAATSYTNVRYLNNRFSTVYYPRGGYHGPFLYCSGATLSGNVWHDGPDAGRPVS